MSQYRAAYGDVITFRDNEVASAVSRGFTHYFSIAALTGTVDHGEVPGADLQTWGEILLEPTETCGLIMYRWDTAYFAKPDVIAAVEALSAIARTKPPCFKQ